MSRVRSDRGGGGLTLAGVGFGWVFLILGRAIMNNDGLS